MPTTPSSPATKLPRELVEMIISHLIYDTSTLLACSLTCYSWHIATVSHLHHSLTTDGGRWRADKKYLWPTPLRESYELGLLPLVARLRIRSSYQYEVKFAPERLDRRTLRYFSALTNLQELGIDVLRVSSFMPTIRQCFEHFSPTLRFLALSKPDGSCRQLLYFIGLFPNLQDLKLHCFLFMGARKNTADAALVPPSIPPLRGRLTLTEVTRDGFVGDMVSLWGGLRFRYMDLFRVNGIRFLLKACANTLETLRLYPTDPYSEEFLNRRGGNRFR
jgi:hypothetical protein